MGWTHAIMVKGMKSFGNIQDDWLRVICCKPAGFSIQTIRMAMFWLADSVLTVKIPLR